MVGTLIVGSSERQIVGGLIIRFLEHQQRNVNLQKGSFKGDGWTPYLIIKLEKSVEKEKIIGVVRIAYLPQWGIFFTYSVRFTKSPPSFSG